MSVEEKTALKEWRLFYLDEFGQSKKRILDSRKGNDEQRKCQQRNNYDNDVQAQIQSGTEKLFNAKLK